MPRQALRQFFALTHLADEPGSLLLGCERPTGALPVVTTERPVELAVGAEESANHKVL